MSQTPFRKARGNKTGTVEIGPFTKVPNKIFGCGLGAQLGRTVVTVYFALLEHANRNGSNTFKVSDRAIEADTGIGTRTICDARKKLIEYQMIICNRANGQSYIYTIRHLSLEWKPMKDRIRRKLKPRAYHAIHDL